MFNTVGNSIKKLPPRGFMSLGLAGAALGIAAAVWLSNGSDGLAGQCTPNPEAQSAMDEVAAGPMGALHATGTGRGYADLAFVDQQGNPLVLADFAGKALLVNFWATWCGPCREEMPWLDAVSLKYGGEDFAVITIGLDMGDDGIEKEREFMQVNDLPNLPLYADPSFKAFERLKNAGVSLGLPTTLLLDASGCELAVLQGSAPWAGEEGNAVVEKLIELHREAA